MKTALPKNETEIVATIVSLVDKISDMENELKSCQQEITSHAVEARQSNKDIHDKISLLQFSVTGLEKSIVDIRATLQSLTELSASLTIIARFIVRFFKFSLSGLLFVSTILAILKYLGKI